jgi:predicted nucleic acid-binding protein
MILVDTSVWVDHLRHGEAALVDALMRSRVAIHPHVVLELACGNLKNRQQVLELLQALPAVKVALDAEVMHLIESRSLMGRGIGFVDAHLCASAILSGAQLWTRDKRLLAVAQALNVAWTEPVH